LEALKNNIKSGHLTIWSGALFFAVILWFFVISERSYVYVVEVPIEVRNIKEGKTLRGEVEPTADVRFRATGRAFLKTLLLKSVSEFKLVLDLEKISTDYDFYLNDYFNRYSQKVVIPAGFELDFIEVVRPDSIHISLDDYMIKPALVISMVFIQPEAGFVQVGPTQLYPSTIELKGPKEIVRFVYQVETVADSFLSLQSSLQTAIPLEFNFPRTVEASHPQINLFADIQSIGERIITEVPITVLNVPQNILAFPNPSTVSLTVTGGVHFIAELEPTDIEVYIDYEKRRIDQPFREPDIGVPEDVIEWRDLSPKTIELTVRRIPE
jgi:hypothetical protein|tara:strand:+ start:237 stop:1211 length:975 start_codon:yes stop_codon:yes gene_type:complete